VLIADDDAMVASALADLVDSEPGFSSLVASEVEEAISLAREHQPSAALVDYRMPDGGGLRLARELARWSPDTKVVAISAEHSRASREIMLSAGALLFLDKASDMPEVLAILRRVLAGEL
jgi:DNA-binding NarL/FixJ family response regulator